MNNTKNPPKPGSDKPTQEDMKLFCDIGKDITLAVSKKFGGNDSEDFAITEKQALITAQASLAFIIAMIYNQCNAGDGKTHIPDPEKAAALGKYLLGKIFDAVSSGYLIP